ncbi:NADPH-dependent F420 reductase (plasmid) [Rhizobium sp. T1470]|uniref:NADPH-dependent F420 reductase n=1 Tax=unclassified Rhizobium TaxID=2613769 RepID=UPI001AAFF3F0|nr:NADPH-dependent F420 reductase [Rhizobium sp. T1473]MCA0805150.1 NADPH-dependent F420 reductase [Rhizobium sp. T1473]
MKYSIIGSGAIGSAIAKHFAKANISVSVANTRGADSLKPLADKLGPAIVPSDLTSALEADVVILAVPYSAAAEVLNGGSNWNGRVIVDATNAIDPKTFGPADLSGTSSSAIVAQHAPGASVVKGFNHVLARILARDADDGRGYGRRTLFISGDVQAAKPIVVQLMERFGFAVIDLGKFSEGGLLQQYGGPLTGHSLITQETHGSSFADMDIVEH